MKKYKNFTIPILAPLIGVFASSCGNSGTSSSSTPDAVSNVSIANLPSAKSMITTNSSASSRAGNLYNSSAWRSVSGTAPILTTLSDSNVDQYFWGGLLTTIINAGSANSAQRNEFWGNTINGAGGMGACQMAQGVGESFSNLISSANTLCYMKGIASGPTGVTIDTGTTATVFDSTTDDKLIKITLTGTGGGGGGGGGGMPSTVFFKVYGSNTLGGTNIYKADLWMCTAGNSVNQIETITVNKSTGEFSDVSTNSQGDIGTATLTATLTTGADGNPAFDPTKSRHFLGKFTGTYSGQTNLYKGDLTINSDNQIISKIYRYNNGTWGLNIDKLSSVASFSGTSFEDLRFLAAGYNGESTHGVDTNTYFGGIEYQDTKYVSVAGSSLAATAATVDVTTDDFYNTDLTAPTLTTTHLCTETPTINITMDFSTPAVSAIKNTCDGDRYTGYSMCYGATVQAAQAFTWGP